MTQFQNIVIENKTATHACIVLCIFSNKIVHNVNKFIV